MTTWNPETYNRNARFVSELGAPVVELLAPQPDERILDLGCGDGALTKKLIDFGCTVIGVDASQEMASAARQLGIDVRVADGHDLPFTNEFDAVFSNAALHWMRYPDRVVSGVWRSLKQVGRFAGEMGGIGNVKRLHAALCKAVTERGIAAETVDPWYFPSPDEYQAKLESVGFKVALMELINRPTALPAGIGGWIESVAHTFLSVLENHEHEEFIKEIEEEVRPDLCDEHGVWKADYVRLRFLALKN